MKSGVWRDGKGLGGPGLIPFTYLHGDSQTFVTLAPEGLTEACIRCTDIYMGKTLIYIKRFFKKTINLKS